MNLSCGASKSPNLEDYGHVFLKQRLGKDDKSM